MQSGSVVGGSCSIAGLTRVVPIVFGVSISNGQHGDEIIQFLCPKKKYIKPVTAQLQESQCAVSILKEGIRSPID